MYFCITSYSAEPAPTAYLSSYCGSHLSYNVYMVNYMYIRWYQGKARPSINSNGILQQVSAVFVMTGALILQHKLGLHRSELRSESGPTFSQSTVHTSDVNDAWRSPGSIRPSFKSDKVRRTCCIQPSSRKRTRNNIGWCRETDMNVDSFANLGLYDTTHYHAMDYINVRPKA